MVTPGRMMARAPIQQSDSIVMGLVGLLRASSYPGKLEGGVPAQMTTSGPMRALSPILTMVSS